MAKIRPAAREIGQERQNLICEPLYGREEPLDGQRAQNRRKEEEKNQPIHGVRESTREG